MTLLHTERALDLSRPAELGVTIERNRPLAGLTSIKVGGPAEYFATVQTVDQLLKLVRWARGQELPYWILGGGSNVLISDAGVRGLVIQNRCRLVRVDSPPCCDYPQDLRPYVFAESGAAMAGLARTSINAGLTGLEWAVSVPGTVGGAVINNAGAHGGEVKDNLWDALILDDNDEVREFKPDQLAYAYRTSALKRGRVLRGGFGPVVLSANFRLPEGDPEEIRTRADNFLAHRRRTQPVEPSLGSTFKNPAGDYAGRLIETAGLQGHRIGGIEISRAHANFFVNPGGVGSACAADVVAMIEHVQERIQQLFHVTLEPEIQWVGEWDNHA
ncbi:MAG: UDP-N-acetylmuramate dehydrogenase [Caldilineaceae bacterium]|nr:UDP-N-acetylmuramate dehydrogenase [Caldilineaceae bacterium]